MMSSLPGPRVTLGLTVVAAGVLIVACLDPSGYRLLGHPCVTTSECGEGLLCGAEARCVTGEAPDASVPPELTLPVRMAGYSSGFPYLWTLHPHDHPSSGDYDANDAGVVKAQVASMQYAHIQVGLFNYDGAGNDSDFALGADLEDVRGTDFRWAVSSEGEDEGNGPADAQAAAYLIRDIGAKYGSHPNFFRLGGKFVVFVHSPFTADPCEVASRYAAGVIRYKVNAYLVLRTETPTKGRYLGCPDQPDAWYNSNENQFTTLSRDTVALSPGAFNAKDLTPQLPRDLEAFSAAVARPLDAGIKFQLITTYNGWVAGSAVESSPTWASDSGQGQYLDVLHDHPL